MTKQEMIDEYLKKVARKHNCTVEQAKEFKMTQNYILYIEREGKDDTGNNYSNDLLDIDDKSC